MGLTGFSFISLIVRDVREMYVFPSPVANMSSLLISLLSDRERLTLILVLNTPGAVSEGGLNCLFCPVVFLYCRSVIPLTSNEEELIVSSKVRLSVSLLRSRSKETRLGLVVSLVYSETLNTPEGRILLVDMSFIAPCVRRR